MLASARFARNINPGGSFRIAFARVELGHGGRQHRGSDRRGAAPAVEILSQVEVDAVGAGPLSIASCPNHGKPVLHQAVDERTAD